MRDELQDDTDRGHGPDGDEHRGARNGGKGDEREGRIAARDFQINCRVIHHLKKRLERGLERCVIDR